MCTVCGCGQGETRIEGDQAHDHAHAHDGGEGHSHPHTHEHAHEHGHLHSHEHSHADGSVHSHVHEHAHSHGHSHTHEHDHEGHDHAHDDLHPAGAEHGHGHADAEIHGPAPSHDHGHAQAQTRPGGDLHFGQGPAHAHAPGLTQARMVQIEQDILGKNNAYAAENRRWFADHGFFAVNLVSSPGSGKTTLLVKTIEALAARDGGHIGNAGAVSDLAGRIRVAVIEGDQQTSVDADRIRATGAPAVQVNTGKGCHLDAHMVGHALEHLRLADDGLVMIENVGNLVCPSAFDLGEAHKVVILSVTEGEDKPLKYPDMFHAADLMILNKIDLLPHLSFDLARCLEYARRVNPRLEVLQVSATSGEGMGPWLDWLGRGVAAAVAARQDNLTLLRRRLAEVEAQLAAKG
ncbi:MAG TPA: hydrogenase nickel incorporation protein HypB [Chromatiaceae bacterium]|nr:hydrogenase nickel incorporation protein HypB [Chromatiaceae bacterium]